MQGAKSSRQRPPSAKRISRRTAASSPVSHRSPAKARRGACAGRQGGARSRSPISPALRKTGMRGDVATGSKERPRPVTLPSSSTSRTISSIGPSVTRSAYSARPLEPLFHQRADRQLLLGVAQPRRIGRFEICRGPARIDGERAEEIGVLRIDLGAAGKQPVEQARIAVRHEDVDVVAGHQTAHVLEAHRAAVAHDQRRAAPSAGCRSPRATGLPGTTV